MPNRSSSDIKMIDDWGHWFELDGKKMEPTVLNVLATFPDKTTHNVQVEVLAGRKVVEDHGKAQNYDDYKIDVLIAYHGVPTRYAWTPQSGITFVWYDDKKPIPPEDLPGIRHRLELADKICLEYDTLVHIVKRDNIQIGLILDELARAVAEYRKAP